MKLVSTEGAARQQRFAPAQGEDRWERAEGRVSQCSCLPVRTRPPSSPVSVCLATGTRGATMTRGTDGNVRLGAAGRLASIAVSSAALGFGSGGRKGICGMCVPGEWMLSYSVFPNTVRSLEPASDLSMMAGGWRKRYGRETEIKISKQKNKHGG